MTFYILLFLSVLSCFGMSPISASARIINNSNASVHVDYDLPIYSRADTIILPIKSQQELQNLLHEAILTNSAKEIMQVVKAGADVNLFKDGKAPLMWATVLKKLNSVEVLKKCGAIIPCQKNMLYRAILNDSADDVKHAINAGADPNIQYLSQEESTMSPLGWAVFLAKPNAVRALLECGAAINTNITRRTKYQEYSEMPLKYALSMKDIRTALVLLNHDKHKQAAQIFSIHGDIFQYVVNIDPSEIKGLILEFLQVLINRGYNINSINGDASRITSGIIENKSAWSSAINSEFYSIEVLELLMKNGANPNQLIYAGGFAWTPLHIAIQANNIRAVKFFLDVGADLTKKAGPSMGSRHSTSNPPGTPLFHAQCLALTHVENSEIINLLIKHGAR
ncbi:MAG: ankyrin repeat domain-containing protein [Candidatus Babeliales bacterium]|nr:ankyrin repeat domain-containing protein [Candidatus Babeliales bacterium]